MQNGHRGVLPAHILVGAIIREGTLPNKGKTSLMPRRLKASRAGTDKPRERTAVGSIGAGAPKGLSDHKLTFLS